MKATSMFTGFLYGLVFMVLIPLALVSLNNYWHLPILVNRYSQPLGIISVVGGLLLGVYAVILFAKYGKGGSFLPFNPPHKLVTEGVYKYIRNPMFTASALVWFGVFFFFGSLLLLPYAVGWVLINHIHLIKQDEKWLEKRFGKEYLDYKKHTTRYIPKLL